MYLADCHNHTCCSEDSEAPLSAMAHAAWKAGLSELCTTDHLDLLGWHGEPAGDWDWTPVLEQYTAALAQCPKGLDLRLGIEVGTPQLDPERTTKILEDIPLDFVIGSVHNQHPKFGGQDFYYLSYTCPEDCSRSLDDYFDSLYQLAGMTQVDVIGHVIYPLRYMKRDGQEVSLESYRDRLQTILRRAIENGRGIELNTNRGKDIESWRFILEQYHQLGGEIITVGTDAHRPEDVGKGVTEAVQLLQQTGFRYYTVFHRRKPEFIPL